uniref:Uncharacterized protein n=1 Tax=Caenorhabditis tropicalis TaxID=1561998 RepID=A0A1I7U1W2_9PELO
MNRNNSSGPPRTSNSSALNNSMSNNNSHRNAGSGMNRQSSSTNQRERSMTNGGDSSRFHSNPSGIIRQGNNDSVVAEVPPTVAPKPMNPAARYLASRRDKNTGQGTSDSTNNALGGVVSQKDNGFKQVGNVLDSSKMNGQHQNGDDQGPNNSVNLNKSFGGFNSQQAGGAKDGDKRSSKNLNKSFGGFDANGEKVNTRYQQRLNRKLKKQQQRASNPDIAQEVIQKVPEGSVTASSTVGVSSKDVSKTAVHSNPSTKFEKSQENVNRLNKSHLGDHTVDNTQQKIHDSSTKAPIDMNKSFGGMTLQGNNGSLFTEVPVAPKPMNPAARYLASRRDTAQGTSKDLNKSVADTKIQHQAGQYGKGQGPRNPNNLNKSFGGFQGGNKKRGGSKSSKNLNKSFGGSSGGEASSKQRFNRNQKNQQQMASNQVAPQKVASEAPITSMAALTDSDSFEETVADVPVNLNWTLPPGNLHEAFEQQEELYLNQTIGTIQYLDEVHERYRPDRFKLAVLGINLPSDIENDSDTGRESPAVDSLADPIVDQTIMPWDPAKLMEMFNKPEFWKSSLEIEIPTVFIYNPEIKCVGYYMVHRCIFGTMPVLFVEHNICTFLHPETFELMNMPAAFLFNLFPEVPHQEGEVAAGLYYFVPKTEYILPDKWTLSNYPVEWLDPTLYNARIKSKYAWELVMQQFLYPNGPLALEIAKHVPRSEAEGVVAKGAAHYLQDASTAEERYPNEAPSREETRASSSTDQSFSLPLGETPMVAHTNRVPLLGMTTRQFRMADRVGNPLPTQNDSEDPPTSPTVD